MTTPCPYCAKPMGARLVSKLAPRIPPDFGPHRTALLEESQEGWCCVCDLPIPEPKGKRVGRYTCGRKECVDYWANMCTADRRWKERQSP